MKIFKLNEKYELLNEEDEKAIREGLVGMFGTLILALGARDLVKKNDDVFTKTGLINGDKVTRTVIDSFRNKKTYEGVIVIRGSIPYVNIKKGSDLVGQMVRWTADWVSLNK